jgi:hypothetical protein
MLYRHGDVLIGSITALPPTVKPHAGDVLLHGEFTGHSHRIQDPASAQLFEHRDELFLAVLHEAAVIVHQEHQPITLPHGFYRIWRQREYTPGAVRFVAD